MDSTLGGGLEGRHGGASDPEWGDEACTYQTPVQWVQGQGHLGSRLCVGRFGREGDISTAWSWTVFLVVGPGGQRHGGREGPDACWEIPAVKGLEHLWPEALVVLLPRRDPTVRLGTKSLAALFLGWRSAQQLCF